MSTQQTFNQRQRPSTDQRERDVIFTARGSSEASRTVRRAGALLGYESQNHRPPEAYRVDFVDWPFSKLDDFSDMGELFDAHYKTVRAEKPRYAVAPDINERVPYRDAIECADDLAEYAETVIVVPKTVMPEEVPVRFRVGMPCQDRYGPRPWKITDYQNAGDVHLLGGSPVAHREILKYYIDVESVDTTVPVTSANWGNYWSGEKWSNIGFQGNHFYPCLKKSYRNMRYMMNRDREVWSPRRRNRKEDYVSDFRENSPDADLWGPDEEPPVHGREAY